MEIFDPVHRIDADNRIVYISPAWREFAQRNGAPDLPARVLGTSLWSHLSGSAVRDASKALVEKVRSSGEPLKLPFRCDAPDSRRFLEMEMTPVGKGEIEIRSRTIRLEERPRVPVPLEAEGDSLLSVCAWCKRFRCEGGWCEIEKALQTLNIFTEELRVSHGICEDCSAQQFRIL